MTHLLSTVCRLKKPAEPAEIAGTRIRQLRTPMPFPDRPRTASGPGFSVLAARTIDTGALPQTHVAQTRSAVLAELPAAPVDEQLLLEIARLAVAPDEIAQ